MRTQLTQSIIASLLVSLVLSGCGAATPDEAADTGQPAAREDVGEAQARSTGTGSTGTGTRTQSSSGGAGGGGYSVTNCQLTWKGSGQTKQDCYTDWTLRTPNALSTCPGEQEDAALCYPWCAAGYYGAGPVCWQSCPDGYTDLGVSCYRAGNIISSNNSACPGYDLCGVTFARGCSTCPPGYANDGCTCRIDPSSFFKNSYGRGVGTPMSCAPGLEQLGALCYGSCQSGYVPDGLTCQATKQTCMTVPADNPPPLSPFCFVAKNPNSYALPCYAVEVTADSQADATTLAQCQNGGYTVTSISCDVYNADTACN